MPITQNIELATLCARRAGNTGRDVWVLTSREETDDLLAKTLRANKVNVFRGDLNNVLKRFYDALNELKANEEDWVIRLTADNLLPDGHLIEDILNFLNSNPCEFLACSHPASELPYGLSAETFKAKHIFQAYQETNDPFDQEHVTPWIRRQNKVIAFPNPLKENLTSFRCTIDTPEDFEHMQNIFQSIDKPIETPYKEIVSKLSQREPSCESKIILGCAQIGMKYGINNQKGELSQEESHELLKTAIKNHIHHFDSAMDYGISEEVLGSFFNTQQLKPVLITKLSSDTLEVQNENKLGELLDQKIKSSQENFQTKQIDTLLFHRKEQIFHNNGQILNWAKKLKDEGIIKTIGCSLTCAEEFDEVTSVKEIEYLQIPVNILDHRWNHQKVLQTKEEKHLKIVSRSIYLQGLVFLPAEKWPEKIKPYAIQTCEKLESLRVKFKAKDMAELCFRYVNSLSWIDQMVIGCEKASQVIDNHHNLTLPRFNEEDIKNINKCFSFLPEDVLNPARWYS